MSKNRIVIALIGVIAVLAIALAFALGRMAGQTSERQQDVASSDKSSSPPSRRASNAAPDSDEQMNTVVTAAQPTSTSAPRDPVEVSGRSIPSVFRGQWGTGPANCANQDDFGPLQISANGFNHYEVSGTIQNVTKTAPFTVRLEFSAEDIGSLEVYRFREDWRINSNDGSLVATTYEGGTQTTIYRRC